MLHAGKTFVRAGMHWDAPSFPAQLPDGFSIRTHPIDSYSGQMLDTFEGHLRLSGKVLLQEPKRITLIDLTTGGLLEQTCSPEWVFARDLRDDAVGELLMRLTRLRAFFPVCEIAVERRQIVVMDELDKTVVRAFAIGLSCGNHGATWVSTQPLRGYGDEQGVFDGALASAGFVTFGAGLDYYPVLGLDQSIYTSRPDIAFGRDTPVYDAATRIGHAFLVVARQNEEGILSDRDTEFLHDFRVSLRRVRSLLSLFQNVYSDADCSLAKTELAEIMKQTNRLRDLDVYLIDRENFFKLVPESMYNGLQTLFDIFAKERRTSYEALCAFLQEGGYRERMDDLLLRFGVPGTMAKGVAADEPSGDFARRMIMKRYNKVAEIARSIKSDAPDETVHDLRIHCKKLRYLIEFFLPLFPPAAIKPLVKSLKGLQDVLGRFNDCSVQRDSLTACVNEHPLRGRKGIILAESVGALVATLYQMQLRARVDIQSSLGGFVHDAARNDFKPLFAHGDSE